ncbi:MAG: bifunctional acetaldehyde-CoA/alcohol dehydrogenase, partial [Candidatus Heimdallarchaeaceae archaeon]
IILKDPETKQKISVAHRSLIPDIDILDPSLTLELPAKLTASTGIDALTHAIEAYTVEWKNDFSDAMAIQAIKLLFEYLPKAVKEGKNFLYREKMHNAATMAGIAFGNSQIGGAHSLAHSAGAVLNIPHGEIISLTLPFIMRYCVEEPKVVKYYSEIAKELDISFQSAEEGAEKLIQEVEKLIKNLGLKTTLKEFGITKEILDKNMDLLADFALNDTGSLVNPRELSNENIKQLYYSMLGE